MANDMISRQAAIDAVEESRRLNHHQDGKEACAHEYEHRHFLKILRDLPSPQPEPKWIPCSEETGDGYPEEDGFYYVTEQNYGFYLDAVYKQRVTHTSHFKNGDFTDRFYTESNSNITAWMPLPEPYQGGREE